jgi:hypothetical protein
MCSPSEELVHFYIINYICIASIIAIASLNILFLSNLFILQVRNSHISSCHGCSFILPLDEDTNMF